MKLKESVIGIVLNNAGQVLLLKSRHGFQIGWTLLKIGRTSTLQTDIELIEAKLKSLFPTVHFTAIEKLSTESVYDFIKDNKPVKEKFIYYVAIIDGAQAPQDHPEYSLQWTDIMHAKTILKYDAKMLEEAINGRSNPL